MCYPAVAVANTILDRAARKGVTGMTPMKLQKLLFFAQAWHLRQKGKRLFPEDVLRWQYGPVIGDVYREFSGFGSSQITGYATNANNDISIIPKNREDLYSFIDKVLDAYGRFSAWQLSDMTHNEGTPWSMSNGEIITDEEMRSGKL